MGAPQRRTKAVDPWRISIDSGEPDKSTDTTCFFSDAGGLSIISRRAMSGRNAAAIASSRPGQWIVRHSVPIQEWR
jgi:hypothetical protein